ncbi:MAG: SGNH/GDSL hydrolase family protein [Candidatus Brocadia sp.]|nr:SGNH/GDSL hydrolase family protein [Candidatus Brocadia sp.]
MGNKKNWFEMNPKKTLLCFFIIIFFVLIFSAEIILSKKSKNQGISQGYSRSIRRSIRLKEHMPFTSYTIVLSKRDMENSDSLLTNNNPFRVDENGFIMPSRIYNNPDLNIVFLGGSTTECAFVSEMNRFPYLVGRNIENETGLKVNSFNSGVGGNDSLHSIDILLNKVLPMKPNIVVMMHNVNDIAILTLEKSYWNNNPFRSVIVVNKNTPFRDSLAKLKNTLIPNLYDTVLREILNTGERPDGFEHVKGSKIQLNKSYLLNEFKNNLRIFISISRIRGITPVLMTQTSRMKDNPDKLIEKRVSHFEKDYQFTYKEYREVYDLFNQAIREVCKENNVLVIDLANEVPPEREYMYDINHFNDNGSIFVASIISKHLIRLINEDGSMLFRDNSEDTGIMNVIK